MMSFTAKTTWESDSSAVVMAQSKLCRYRILIDETSVTVYAPGLEMSFDREDDLPLLESYEALALSALLQLEAGA